MKKLFFLPLLNFTTMLHTPIDFFIIKKVEELLEKAGLKQEELSHFLGFATGSTHISSAERFSKAKYNIYHLNKLPKILNCDIADLLPHPYRKANSLQDTSARTISWKKAMKRNTASRKATVCR